MRYLMGAAMLALTAAAPAGAPATAPAAADSCAPDRPVWLDPVDQPLCNDCGTCYQELPQLFEQTTIVVDGVAQQVAQIIPGSLETVEITPDMERRIKRVRDTCDAEIIR